MYTDARWDFVDSVQNALESKWAEFRLNDKLHLPQIKTKHMPVNKDTGEGSWILIEVFFKDKDPEALQAKLSIVNAQAKPHMEFSYAVQFYLYRDGGEAHIASTAWREDAGNMADMLVQILYARYDNA
jgi:hypothetical protein